MIESLLKAIAIIANGSRRPEDQWTGLRRTWRERDSVGRFHSRADLPLSMLSQTHDELPLLPQFQHDQAGRDSRQGSRRSRAGYEAIELWHDDIDRHLSSGGQLAEIRQAVDDAGLVVPTSVMLKGWCEPDGPEYQQGIEECKRRMEQSVTVGAIHARGGSAAWSG